MQAVSLKKKLIHLLTLSLSLLYSFTPCIGQNQPPVNELTWRSIYDLPEGASFEVIQKNFEDYWRGRAITKGKGYKPFKRWEAYMEPRIYPSNDMRLVNNTYFNYLKWEKEVPPPAPGQKSFAGNWTPLGPFVKATGGDTGVGRLNMLRFDPTNSQTMYVGAADGGLWKSINGGDSWTTNTDFLTVIGVADLAINPSNTSIMYLATGDAESDRRSIGVLRSTNGGSSWQATGLAWTAIDDYSIRKLLMHPTIPTTLLAATNKGVFRTTNGGTTWTVSNEIQNFKDMEFKPGDPNTVYATSNEMWKSTDNGVNWTKITNGVPNDDVVRMSVAVTPANPAIVYLLAGKQSNSGLKGIYKSVDSGVTFTTRFEPDYNATLGVGNNNPNILGNEYDGSDAAGQSFYTLAFAVHPTDPDFLLAGGVSQWASFDGGATWSISSFWLPDEGVSFVHADSHEITFNADGSKAYSCHDGGLAMFTDGVGDWTDLSNNLNISQQNILGISNTDATHIVAGLQDIGTIYTSATPWKVVDGGDGEYCFIDYNNDLNIVVTGTNGSHSLSTDGGNVFNPITSGLPTGDGMAEFKSPIHQDPIVPSRYYAGGRQNLYRSDNMGGSWTMLGAPFSGDHIVELKIAPNNNLIIYATNSVDLAKSTDGGDTWSYLNHPANSYITQITVSDSDPNKVWFVCSGYTASDKVFKSTDGGSTWTNLSTGLPNLPFNTIAFQSNSNDLVYIGGDIGVYYRDAASANWTSFFTALPNTSVRDLKISPSVGKIRAATYGRGTWESDVVQSVLPVELISFTGVANAKSNTLEWTTALEVNFSHYELERSDNNRRFNSISSIASQATGNNGPFSYVFEDLNPVTGLNYYRLKMVDTDGTFAYSRIIALVKEGVTDKFNIYPNPVVQQLNIEGLGQEDFTYTIRDMMGRQLLNASVNGNVPIDVSRLPNGAYFLEIRTLSDQLIIKRFVKE